VNHHSFRFMLVVAACMLLLFLGTDAMAKSKTCSLTGTWFGEAGNTWTAIVTPGKSATGGQLYLEWVLIDPTLGGEFPSVVRVSNGVGVWQQVNNKEYKWSWVYYGFDASGTVIYTTRFSGTSSLSDCDHAEDTWVNEVWLGGQDMNTDPPNSCGSGTGTETRMPLVQAVCE
jgi:hypothetical protein